MDPAVHPLHPTVPEEEEEEEEEENEDDETLSVIIVYNAKDVDQFTVKQVCSADVIIVSSTLLYDTNYLMKLNTFSKTKNEKDQLDSVPKSMGAAPPETLKGFWIPFGRGQVYGAAQHTPIKADSLAHFHLKYSNIVASLRSQTFEPDKRGVPLEWFMYRRVVYDEGKD